MTEAELSSIYSQGEDAVRTHKNRLEIRLQDNLLSQHLRNRQWVEDRTSKDWIEKIFKESAVYEGFDELLWGKFYTCVYKDPATGKLSLSIIDKLGVTHFNPVSLSLESQFYPAIENLDPKDKTSNVRKCIAVSLLEKFAQVPEQELRSIKNQSLQFDYDPTHAGDLASRCKLVEFSSPEDFGRKLLSLGFLQKRFAHGALFDVVYEQKPSTTDSNNRIVFNLGDQLEQLFDPLSEYSPEQTEYTYKSPERDESSVMDNSEVKSILHELLQLQTTFTLSLVEFLQGFLINLRVQVLNNGITGLSTMKLNRLFPPTIDEVTRINCIFLDSLKSATPYGSLEVLKACSLTIPYFYKAYTRHEAATKNFNKDVKLFLRRFSDKIPDRDVYTEMKIETIIRGPQEKLMKIKLIIDRLFATKEWDSKDFPRAGEFYKNISETIDSFGKLEAPMSSYSTRVFTPSGKILTELAKGWPVELQYKWLRRRIVGVYDIVEEGSQGKRMLLVIFSDYVVFLDIDGADQYYTSNGHNKPQLADILMNSLINEVPLPPKMPRLTVASYCFIDDVFVSSLNNHTLRFDALKEDNSFSIVCTLVSSSIGCSKISELIVKAKILEKETAFHLFRATSDGITVYLTAHEMEAYESENIKSKFVIFLNMDPSVALLQKFELHLGIFIEFANDAHKELLKLNILTSDGRSRSETVPPKSLVLELIRVLAVEIPTYYSSVCSPIVLRLLKTNQTLIERIPHNNRQIGNECGNEGLSESEVSESFVKEHEKKKSFGTITTYRSDVSDLKDATSKVDQRQMSVQQKILPESTITARKSKKPAKGKQQPFGRKMNNPNKRRSIVNIVLGFFGSKGQSTNKGKSGKGTKAKEISPITKKPQASPGTISVPKAKHVEGMESYSDQRISSVVRNPNTIPTSSSGINSHIDQEDVTQTNGSEVTSSEKTSKRSSNSLHSSHSEVSAQEALTHMQRASSSKKDLTAMVTKSKANAEFYMQAGRQSQLFDDDLFGDLIVRPSITEKVKVEAKDSAVGQMQILAESQNCAAELEKEQTNSKSHEYTANGYSGLEGNQSLNNSNLSNDCESVPSVKANREANLSKDSVEYEEDRNSIDRKPVRNDNEISSIKPTDQNILKAKEQIFPSIPVIEPSKINFERSSSFIELFEGMRLVLDESDAQYNWKSLSNDVAEIDPNHGTDYVPHAFKSIALTTGDKTVHIDARLPSRQTSGDSNTCTEPKASKLETEHKKVVTEDDSPVNFLDEISFEDKLVGEPTSIRPMAPAFKVVKASPTRIVKRASLPIDSECTEQSFKYTFSISSDLNKVTDKRWFELKLPSQEDLQADGFYTPTEEPSPKFTEDIQGDSETPSPFKSSGEATDISEESFASGKNKQDDRDSVLEDIDFSSFHVTFDTTESKPEGSPSTTSQDGLHKENRTLPGSPPIVDRFKDHPLVYRLPVYTGEAKAVSSVTNLANNLSLPVVSDRDDDPIWVSPSKLEFYDLSRVTESGAFPRHSEKENINKSTMAGHDILSTATGSAEDEKDSLRELSYAYLASLVTQTESHFADDKPERLHFKE